MTATHVRDYVRRITVTQDPEPQPAQVMWSRDECMAKLQQTTLECYLCCLPILPGEQFYVVTEFEGRVRTQSHVRCDEDARR